MCFEAAQFIASIRGGTGERGVPKPCPGVRMEEKGFTLNPNPKTEALNPEP